MKITLPQLRRIIRQEFVRSGFLNERHLIKAVEKRSRFDRKIVFTMLESGFFTREEEAALRVAFRRDNFRYLNESFVNRFDRKVYIINESAYAHNEMFAEAFGDTLEKLKGKVSGGINAVKEKASSLMSRAKEALTGGWEKVKTIWKNFSDVIKQLCSLIVDGLKQLWDATKAKSQAIAEKGKKLALEKFSDLKDSAKKAKLGEETEHIVKIHDFWNVDIYSEWILGKKWVAGVIEGSSKPEGNTKNESLDLMTKHFDFSDYFLLEQIYNRFGSNFLLESEHGEKHLLELETFVKNPVGHNIIKWGIKIMHGLFSPLAFLIKEVAKFFSNKGLTAISWLTEKLGGPEMLEYHLLGAIIGEVLSTLAEGLVAKHLTNEAFAHAMHFSLLGLAAPQVLGLIKIMQALFMCYGVVVIVANVVNSLVNTKKSAKVHESAHRRTRRSLRNELLWGV